jgi:uncharacterized membrane protein
LREGDPDEEAVTVRHVFFIVYAVMGVWLVLASVLRVVLSLRSGVPIDVLPAVTGGLGLVALLLLVPRAIRRIRRARRSGPETLAEQLERHTSRRATGG